jgi:MFS family permease
LEVLLAVCGIGFGLALVIFALMQSFLLASLVLVFCGAGATMTMMVANTLLQTYAPAEVRGRVMSLYTFIAAGCTQLGALIISSLARGISLEDATIVAGLGVGVVVVFTQRKLKVAKGKA